MKSNALLAAGIAALAMCASAPSQAQEEYVVGATVPITGNFAATGINYYSSLRMAQDDINAKGGINGKKLKIVFEDTQSSNSTAVNALVKLVKQTKPPLIFLNSLSVQILAQEPEITKAAVPTLYSGALVALQGKSPYMFRIRPADNLQARMLAKGVVDVMKAKKPAILHMQDDYGAGTSKLVTEELKNLNIDVATEETFSPRDNDFSAQLLKIKNSGADSVICITYNRDGALIMKQRRALGLDSMPFLCTTPMFAATTLELLEPDDLKNVYAAGDVVLDQRSDASRDFVKRFNEKFGFKPDPYGAAYYDATMMLADAIAKNGDDPAKLQAYFAALAPYDGVAQKYWNQKNGTNNLAHSVVLVKFKPGSKDFEQIASYSEE